MMIYHPCLHKRLLPYIETKTMVRSSHEQTHCHSLPFLWPPQPPNVRREWQTNNFSVTSEKKLNEKKNLLHIKINKNPSCLPSYGDTNQSCPSGSVRHRPAEPCCPEPFTWNKDTRLLRSAFFSILVQGRRKNPESSFKPRDLPRWTYWRTLLQTLNN